MTRPEADPAPPLTAEYVLNDPAASLPLKSVLSAWLGRDPVDAATDAEALAHVLGGRADALLGRAP